MWYVSVPIPLLFYSLISAFTIFIPIWLLGWGAGQIGRHRVGRGISVMLLVFLVIGFAVSNSPLQSKVVPSPSEFYSSLSYLGNYTSALAQTQSGESTSTATSPQGPGVTSTSLSSLATTTIVTSFSGGSAISDPAFYNGKSNITYPVDYSTLANYALGLINHDRQVNGAPPESLSNIPSGQQHSDSMAYYGYFSHWDTQGYKPYMRYTMLGGTGGVAENGGLDYCTGSPLNATLVTPVPCSIQTIENGIANSEWGMMNNDQLCCNNGHRDNILNPLHNKVSIGIAYDSSSSAIYFVEDFEDAYTSFHSPFYSSGLVTLSGSTTVGISVEEVMVAYDSTPAPLTPAQLGAAPYNDGYQPGTSLGAVFAPCPRDYTCSPNTTDGRIAVYAMIWNLSSGNFEIQFDPSRFFAHGAGVYTLYLFDSSGNIYTTLSILHS
ncbi:MAG: CAP domain-containing protein [Nitrososphaerota archaeon]|nr:CAP domain-containing protein [Nitrososphaerota archaeon]